MLRILLLAQVCLASTAAAQPKFALLLGADVPLTYSLGVDARWTDRWSTELRGHLLTAPFDAAIVGIAESFGLDDTLGRAIRSAFQLGGGGSLSVRYHFGSSRRHAIRASAQYLHLDGGNAAIDLLESALDRSFTPLRAPQPGSPPPLEVYLQADLWMLGVYYTYDLPLGQDRTSTSRWFLRLEAGLGKVVGSTSTFSSNRPRLDGTRLVQTLYSDLAADLTEAFADYGYTPSLNVHIGWRFAR